MKLISRLIEISVIAIVSLATWHLLSHNGPDWLIVETPPEAINGKDFSVKITLRDYQPHTYIGVDLHGMSKKKEPKGFIKGAPSVIADRVNSTYEFKIKLPPEVDVANVFPVIILSEKGTWGSRIKAAYTDEVPVRVGAEIKIHEKYEARSVSEITDDKSIPAQDNFFISVLTASSWIAAAAIAYIAGKNISPGFFIPAAIVSSAAEMLYYLISIVDPFRLLAHSAGLYNSRRGPQMIITAALIIISAICVVRLLSSIQKDYKRTFWIFIFSFWTVMILQILSLHEIDALLSIKVAGINTGQLARAASALLCTSFSVAVYKKEL